MSEETTNEYTRMREAAERYRELLEMLIDVTACDAGNPDGGNTQDCQHCQMVRELAFVQTVLELPPPSL